MADGKGGLREERKGQNSGSLIIPLPRLRRTSRMPSKNGHTINKLIITQTSMGTPSMSINIDDSQGT